MVCVELLRATRSSVWVLEEEEVVVISFVGDGGGVLGADFFANVGMDEVRISFEEERVCGCKLSLSLLYPLLMLPLPPAIEFTSLRSDSSSGGGMSFEGGNGNDDVVFILGAVVGFCCFFDLVLLLLVTLVVIVVGGGGSTEMSFPPRHHVVVVVGPSFLVLLMTMLLT